MAKTAEAPRIQLAEAIGELAKAEREGVCLTFRADGNHEFVKEP